MFRRALLLLTCALLAFAPAAALHAQPLPEGARPLAIPGHELIVRSTATKRDWRVRIQLPISGANANAPIALALVSRAQAERIGAALHEIELNQANYGVILVTIDPVDPLSEADWEARYVADYAVGGADTRAFEAFVAEELIPFLKARYPESEKVVIGGIDQRGQFVLRLAAWRPDLADRFLVRSPTFEDGAAAAIHAGRVKPKDPSRPSVEILYDREALDAPGELDALLSWFSEEGYLDASGVFDGSQDEAASTLAQIIASEAMVPPR